MYFRALSLTCLLASAVAFAPARVARPSSALFATKEGLQTPHGGVLKENIVTDEAEKKALAESCDVTLQLTDRQLCDVELLANGGFSPLSGFMTEEEYKSVVSDMKLPSGILFSLPVVFDTDSEDIQPGQKLLLKQGDLDIAVMTVKDKYVPDKALECLNCYGTSQLEHPGTVMVAMERGKYYMGGEITGLNKPVRDFDCQTPAEVRAQLPEGVDVVAFQCRNPIHRAHYELFTRSLDAPEVGENAVCLVHPTCGPTQAGDIPGTVRYQTYVKLKEELNNDRISWAYLPYSMHMAGPREAIHHMMIRKNFGCTHFIVGRDMAGSKSSVTGDDFYGGNDAQDFAKKYQDELGVKVVPSPNLVATEEGYMSADQAKEKGLEAKKLSGTKFRAMMRAGDDIPEWFAFPSVVEVLRANM